MYYRFSLAAFLLWAFCAVSPPVYALKATALSSYQYSGRFDGVRFSPDGKLLADADAEQKIKVVDVQTGQQVATLDVGRAISNSESSGNSLSGIVFSPDSRIIATSTAVFSGLNTNDIPYETPIQDKGKVQLWDARSGRLMKTFVHTDKDWNNDFYHLNFSRDSKMLAVLSYSSQKGSPVVELWSVATGRFLRFFTYGSMELRVPK